MGRADVKSEGGVNLCKDGFFSHGADMGVCPYLCRGRFFSQRANSGDCPYPLSLP